MSKFNCISSLTRNIRRWIGKHAPLQGTHRGSLSLSLQRLSLLISLRQTAMH